MRILLALSFLALLSSCATIFTGTNDKITFNSNVDPVKVYIDGLYVGNTPVSVDVDRKVGEGREVTFKKEGFETQQFKLKNKFNWIAISDISSVIVSGGVDVLTGALMEYSPKQYHIEMMKQGQVSESNGLRPKQVQFASFVLTYADDIKRDLASGDGPTLKNLITLVTADKSPYKFSKWLSDNAQSLMSTATPEELLSKLRSSGLTP